MGLKIAYILPTKNRIQKIHKVCENESNSRINCYMNKTCNI